MCHLNLAISGHTFISFISIVNSQISPKSDVWSLGCILYLLLYKKTPFAHIKNIYAKMQAIINPNKDISYSKLPNYYPPMLLEVSRPKIIALPKDLLLEIAIDCGLLFISFQMVQLCLKHNPKERASVTDILKFPFDMVIPIDK